MVATPGADRASAERTARMLRNLEWLMAPILVALGFMIASFSVRNSDFWMHLATGRLIAEGKYSFGVDPYSHASAGLYWTNNSWLYDAILYQLYQLSPSHSAVVMVKAALVALIAVIMLLAGRPEAERRIAPGSKVDPSGWIAAIMVGVALLAVSSRLLVQPALVSFLLTTTTFLLLQRSRTWPVRRLPIVLGLLFALWANLDQWFFLGPVLVAAFLIGELLQVAIPGSPSIAQSRLKSLSAALLFGLAACLINPHHYHVFTELPIELNPNVAKEMQLEPGMRILFLSPTDVIYQNSAVLGQSIAGLSYLALIILSGLSFGLTAFRPRLSLLLVWAVCLALSLYNWRLIPFFAVVAAPITALNAQAFFARRQGREFASSPATGFEPTADQSAEPGGLAASTAFTSQPPQEAWWPGAIEAEPGNRIAEAPAPTKNTAGATVTPEGMLMFGSIVGRLSTLALGVLLLAAAYPGWLHTTNMTKALDYRFSWEVSIDPSYEQFAKQLADWRREGKMPRDAKGMPLHPSLGHYLAWFAPEEKGFLDLRFQLLGGLSGDYVKVKRGLNDVLDQVENPADYPEVLRRRGITHVIISDSIPGEFARYLQVMFSHDKEWALWFQNGRIAIFGWHGFDPNRTTQPADPLRVDLESLAFGPNVARIPAPETVGATRELPPDPTIETSFFDRYLATPAPFPATETDTALAYLGLQPGVLNRASEESANVYNLATFAASVAQLASPPGLPPPIGSTKTLAPEMPHNFVIGVVIRMGQLHPLPAACRVLAVREALRGVLAQPNSGRAHLVLALAYQSLPQVGTVIRSWQQTAATRQALARLKPEERDSPELGPLVTLIMIPLIREHKQRGQMDLALEVIDDAMKQYAMYPPAFHTEKQKEQELIQLAKEKESLEKIVGENKEKFTLELREMQRRNVPVQDQVALAFRFGLIREAKSLLDDASLKLEIATMHELIAVHMMLGQPEEAQRVLEQVPEQFRAQFLGEQIHVWTALGDYARAGSGMESDIARMERSVDPKKKTQQYVTLLGWILASAIDESKQCARLSSVYGFLAAHLAADGFLNEERQRADLNASRAMLALEEGDLAAAKKYFDKASAYRVGYAGDIFAAICMRSMERQAARAKK